MQMKVFQRNRIINKRLLARMCQKWELATSQNSYLEPEFLTTVPTKTRPSYLLDQGGQFHTLTI